MRIASGVEIVVTKPRLDDLPDLGPFIVQDRLPRRVAVPALCDHMVVKHALETKAEASGGVARFRIERIAAPLHAAIAKFVHGVGEQHEQRLGRRAGSLQLWRKPDAADFYDAVQRSD